MCKLKILTIEKKAGAEHWYSYHCIHRLLFFTGTRLILSPLRLESPQYISSSKRLCCHHSNNYLSRTLDLQSLLLCGYCYKNSIRARAPVVIFPIRPIACAYKNTTRKNTKQILSLSLSLSLSETRIHKHRRKETHA